MNRILTFAIASLALTGCYQLEPTGRTESDPGPLFVRLAALCGQAFEGRVTSDDPRDTDWASQTLVMHVRECSEREIRIPLHVGEDRSRTWIVTDIQLRDLSWDEIGDPRATPACQTEFTQPRSGLRFKHLHRHEDGSEDVLSMYGGQATALAACGAAFPADEYSRALFEREGIPDSMENVWSITLTDTTFTYALDRPNRHFEAVFDLTRAVDAPPPPWGDE